MQMASMASMADRHDNLEHVGGPQQIMRNTLHINTGTDKFLEGAWLAGIAQTEWTWAIRSADFDNDGLSDLFFCNGVPRQFNHSDLPEITHASLVGKTHWDHYKNTPERREQNLSFKNLGNFQFEDSSKQWGLDHVGMSYGASLGDLDGDGRLDLLTSNLEDPLSVYHNQGDAGNRTVIELKGTRSNSRGIGTLVTLETPDGVRQSRQLFPYGGFLDADEPIIHFGLGENEKISLLRLQWPSGEDQVFRDLEVNHRFTITEPDTKAEPNPAVKTRKPKNPWFVESHSLKGFSHKEEEFDDFARQPLLPFKLSQLGPGQAWGDIDGDGLPDFFLSGAAGQAGQLFRNQTGEGSREILLSPEVVPALQEHADHEDMGCLFFDSNGNGHLDLYVVSGGVECEPGSELLRDRLYLNSGNGEFTLAPEGTLPDLRNSGSVVAACDFDRDGDLDLFIGSRSIPGHYFETPTSVLLRNDGGKFTSVALEVAPGLSEVGMVTSALWTDVDNDGWMDLIITTDWGPIRLFKNNGGTFTDHTEAAGLLGKGKATLGWWTGIDGRDITGNGHIDYVVTNMGRNTSYRASLDSPELAFYGDFDQSGKSTIVEARFLVENGRQICYPTRGFSAASNAMPYILDRMQTFHNYASQNISGIYDIKLLQAAKSFRANNMDNSVLINDGTGKFSFLPLPHLSQVSPSFGVMIRDVDLDGIPDCYLVQNHFTPQEELEVFASGLSMLMKGTGDKDRPFEVVWPHESGLEVPGDAKSLSAVDINLDGREDFIVGVNDSDPQIFINNTAGQNDNHPLRIRLDGGKGNPYGVGAKVTVKAGNLPAQTAEVYAGGGYLSQASPYLVFAVPNTTKENVVVTIQWPDGNSSTSEAKPEMKFLSFKRK